MIARSRQMDWMELNSPTQMQAQITANAPFFVAGYSLNILSPVTREMIPMMMSVEMSFFHCFSLQNRRKHFPA